jgi:hypothetical protein
MNLCSGTLKLKPPLRVLSGLFNHSSFALDGLRQRPPARLTLPAHLFHVCSHGVETLGVPRSLGWKVHMRCTNGYREETRSMRKCVYRKQLDLETLVATRGPNFPLSRLESRLMCPACGNRRVVVVFEPPSNAARMGNG